MKIPELKTPYIAITALLLIALFPLPYGYYTFLKITVMFFSGLTAHILFQEEKKNLLFWICLATAILYNPIIKISLDKEIWMIINVLTAGFFGYLTYKSVKNN